MFAKLLSNKFYVVVVLLVVVGMAMAGWFFLFKKTTKQGVQNNIQFTTDATDSATAEIKILEPRDDYEKQMLAAAQEYWAKEGTDPEARVVLRDFGCHVGVEAIKDNKTISKMQYDGSTITEYKES